MIRNPNAAIEQARMRARALRTQDREMASKLAIVVASAPAASPSRILTSATTFVGNHR